MANIEVPDELLEQAKGAVNTMLTPPAQEAGGELMPDPMAVNPVDQLEAAGGHQGEASEMTLDDLGVETDPFQQALNETDARIAQQLQEGSDRANEEQGPVGQTLDAVNRVGLGILQSGIETGQFFGSLIGNPDIGLGGAVDAIDRDIKELDRRSGINAFLGTTAQFVTGLVGLNKVLGMTKFGTALNSLGGGGGGKLAVEVGKGMVVGGVAMDPHAGRLSDLIVQYPFLQNPVSDYLSSDPTDSDAEARLKNALEGAGMDLVVAGVFSAALKVFARGKAVEAGTLPKEALDEAAAELDQAVADAKAPGSSVTPPVNPEAVTVGGSPAQVLPEPGPNLLTREAGATLPTEQGVKDMAEGLTPRDPQAEAIARTITGEAVDPNAGKLPAQTTPNLLHQEASASGKPLSNPVPPTVSRGVGGAIVDEAKAAGVPIKRQPGAVDIERALGNVPKIETNGLKYGVISQKQMTDLGSAYGIDSSNWLGAANRDTGEIFISDRVLAMPPARQAEIIAHETGHVLEKQFVKAVTGVEGSFRSLSAEIKAELKAASRKLRPEHWDLFDKASRSAKRGSKTAAREADKHGRYLHSDTELFADSFALWKTRREEFRQVAPQLAAQFDEHFSPWINHDFTSHAADVDAAVKGLSKAPQAPAAQPGLYADRAKAIRTAEQYEQQVTVSPDAAAEVARVAANDAAAIKQHGSQQAAEAAGYRFGKANLPYQKLRTSEDVAAFLAQTAARFKSELDELKDGAVLSDPRVEAAIKQRVDLFNEDPGLVMGQLQAAGRAANSMVANMEAAFTVANKAAMDLDQLVKNNRAGNYAEFGGDANAAEAALAPRLALYIEALGAAQAMRSSLGRGMRRLRGDFILDEATLNSVRKLAPEEVTRLVDMANGNRRMLAKTATQGFWDRFVRGAGSLFANNLLWNWTSHARNLLGNTFMLSTTPAMRAIGSFGMREGGQTVRVQALREYRYMMSSLSDAAHMAVQAYLKGDSALDPYGNEYFREAQGGQARAGAAGAVADVIGLKKINTVGDAFGNLGRAFVFLTGQPTRVLGMADEFFKQTSYRGSVLAEASIKADELGLTGQDFKDYLQSQLDDAFDAQGRATNAEALYDAEVKTFSQPLLPGTMGKSISTFVNSHPTSRFILPFVRTPANLFRYAVKLTPGLNLLQKEYREMLRGEHGPKRQADAYGQFAMAGLLTGIGVNMALSGMITGGGPTGPGQLSTLMATGWRPYSLVLPPGPDGKRTYIPFNNMDPVGQTLSLVADITQIIHMGDMGEAEIDQLVLPTVTAMATNLANRTYLRSLNDAFDAIGNPDQFAANWLGNTASGMVPFSSLLRASNPDPYMREARGILDKVMAGIPGFSEDLPPRRDYAGEPVIRTTGLTFTDTSSEIADMEQQRMLVNFGTGITPLNAVQKGGVDLRMFRLESTGLPAFDRYQELISHPKGFELGLKDALARLIQTEGYARMSDGGGANVPGTKMDALQTIVNKYRQVAYAQLLQENPDLRNETALQQQSVREAIRSGQPVGLASQLRRANEAFGLSSQ